MSAFLPFALPEIGEEEIAEVVDSLKSGWVTTGPKSRLFEQEFGKCIGTKHAVAVNSATAGLHLALDALGIGPGDEVITTTYTFTATAEVINYLGAKPIFVDVDQSSYNIDPACVESSISPRTKAIIPVHVAGLSCDMDAIHKVAREKGLSVVEDAAHSFPARYNGKLIGSLSSDVTVFSFYATKTITTGEGGMIVTDKDDVAKRCRIMRLHGIDRDVFNRYRSEKASWQYEVIAPGYKYNMADIAAAIGIHQLKKAERFRERRARIAEIYDRELADFRDRITIPYADVTGEKRKALSGEHAWHLYLVSINSDWMLRDAFIEKMALNGIGTSVHFIPLHMHPYWRNTLGYRDGDFPIAESLYRNVVSLPIYSKMTDDDVARVVTAIKTLIL
ncbi:MAG: DegT/DnrJ/EryC1/StrS family aminotransferase [Deltaproteobacteria bacterium]|nr:DegT/DnrJ/EryC1/StrS family aminotransferase [Deltaproteobacteria bacterium]